MNSLPFVLLGRSALRVRLIAAGANMQAQPDGDIDARAAFRSRRLFGQIDAIRRSNPDPAA